MIINISVIISVIGLVQTNFLDIDDKTSSTESPYYFRAR